MQRPRLRRPRRADVLVVLGLVGFVAATYVVVVIGGGRLLSSTEIPTLALPVVATVIVAVGFDPVRRGLSELALRWTGRPRTTPARVLSRFLSGTSTASTPEEAASRMAVELVEGLGLEQAQVWVKVHGRLQLAAACPETAEPLEPPVLDGSGDRPDLREVRYGGQVLGALRVVTRDGQDLLPVEDKLLDGLSSSAGLVLRNLQLNAELEERYRQVRTRARALAASRQHVVLSEDEERRRLERDIHDGAQQRLVALAVNLRVARTRLDRDASAGAIALEQLRADVDAAESDLLDVVSSRSHVIATAGLEAAVRSLADTCPVPTRVVGRLRSAHPAGVERAVYYCCAEALQNVSKHSRAGQVILELDDDDHQLRTCVRDDGIGFPAGSTESGHGLRNITERIAAVGGSVDIRSSSGSGTTVTLLVPAHSGVKTP